MASWLGGTFERRGLVGLDQVGAALIARLTRDQRRHTHRGLGAWRCNKPLHRILHADQHLANRAEIVDALNDRAADWYAGWGFTPLPGGASNRLWLPITRATTRV